MAENQERSEKVIHIIIISNLASWTNAVNVISIFNIRKWKFHQVAHMGHLHLGTIENHTIFVSPPHESA